MVTKAELEAKLQLKSDNDKIGQMQSSIEKLMKYMDNSNSRNLEQLIETQ